MPEWIAWAMLIMGGVSVTMGQIAVSSATRQLRKAHELYNDVEAFFERDTSDSETAKGEG